NRASIRIPVYVSWALCRVAVQFAVRTVLLDKGYACSRKARDESWPVSRVPVQPAVEPILFARDSPGSCHPTDPRRAIFAMQPAVTSKFLKGYNPGGGVAKNYRRSFRRFAV